MESRPFRILSLDGGGIKGAIAALALATLWKHRNITS
jgi:patatin-like phospholipase/acyl hydrolase